MMPLFDTSYATNMLRSRIVRFAKAWLLTPKAWDTIYSFYEMITEPLKEILIPPESPSTLCQLRYANFGKMVLWVPREKIRYLSGVGFSEEQHHFVRYLLRGQKDLERFYRTHQPKNALSRNFLTPTEPREVRADLWSGQPWMPPPPPPPKFEFALSEVWDHHAWGPITEQRLAKEMSRLDKIIDSIRDQGFINQPGEDFPSYQLLHDDLETQDFRVLVATGNHRVAALASLGWDFIPMKPITWAAREVFLSDLGQWPGVVDGRFTEAEAQQIFFSFFRNFATSLLADW